MYYDVIGGKQNARDLGTILKNIERDRYSSVDQIRADFEQMVRNAQAFNPPMTPVHESSKDLKRLFEDAMAEHSKKRPGEQDGGGAPKKLKLT